MSGPVTTQYDEQQALLARVCHAHAETALVKAKCLLSRKLHEAAPADRLGLHVALEAIQSLLDEHKAACPPR